LAFCSHALLVLGLVLFFIHLIVTSVELVKRVIKMINIRKIFIDSLRLYFAPLVGAFNAVRSELKRYENERT
jgi:hypothetical protein